MIRLDGMTNRMLLVQNVGCIRDNKTLFSRITFQLCEGHVAAVLGVNGSGKTTLLRIISGLLSPTIGSVTWDARPLDLIGDTFKRSMIFIGHTPSFKLDLTPIENLRSALYLSGARKKESILDSLSAVGLGEVANVPCEQLSAGQKQRLGIARLVAQEAKLWVLDEPSNSLDEKGFQILEELISAHLANGGLAVVATHSPLKVRAKEIHVIELAKESVCSMQ